MYFTGVKLMTVTVITGKMYMKEKIRFKKIAKMTVTENWDDRKCTAELWSATVILAIFLNRIFSFIYIFQT
jgi:hypothetical protein